MENHSNKKFLGMNDPCWKAVHIKLLTLKDDVVGDVREAIKGQSHMAKYNDILRNEWAKFKVELKLDVSKEHIDEFDTKVVNDREDNQRSCVHAVENKLAISGSHELGPFTVTIYLSCNDIKLSAFLFCSDIPSRFVVY